MAKNGAGCPSPISYNNFTAVDYEKFVHRIEIPFSLQTSQARACTIGLAMRLAMRCITKRSFASTEADPGSALSTVDCWQLDMQRLIRISVD